MSEGNRTRPASAWPRRLVVPGKLLLGLLVPTGLYYLLRAGGVSVYLSLLAAAVPAVVSLVRERRPDGLST